jgi:hypothetical protein
MKMRDVPPHSIVKLDASHNDAVGVYANRISETGIQFIQFGYPDRTEVPSSAVVKAKIGRKWNRVTHSDFTVHSGAM